MRDRGDSVKLVLLKEQVRRIARQREAVLAGVLLGGLLVLAARVGLRVLGVGV